MRFARTYSRPTLTPLGQRLLVLSERKLYDLDAPIGARESGTALLRGVLVRETVRAAWDAVDEGRQGGLSDWSSATAMGLDVIGEGDEEEQEEGAAGAREDRWFEDLLSELGDEGEEQEADSGRAIQYSSESSVEVLPAYESFTEVEIVEVERIEDESTALEVPTYTASHIEFILPSPDLSPPASSPITPIDEYTNPDLLPLDELECDDLPPLLHRSWSSDSCGSEECLTPIMGCLELEEYPEYEWGGGSEIGKAAAGVDYEDEEEWDEQRYGKTVMVGVGAGARGLQLRGF